MSVELPSDNSKHVVAQHCEIVRDVYQTLNQCSLDKFAYSLIDPICNDLNAVLYDLDHLPDAKFKELIEVIASLSEARNELRLARFLFDLEEVNAVYRLIMRNRAVLRGNKILHKVLRVWPLYNSSHE